MAKVIQFPLSNLSDKDKKIIRLETYIKTNLIDMAVKRKELVALAKKLRKMQLRLVENEQAEGKE